MLGTLQMVTPLGSVMVLLLLRLLRLLSNVCVMRLLASLKLQLQRGSHSHWHLPLLRRRLAMLLLWLMLLLMLGRKLRGLHLRHVQMLQRCPAVMRRCCSRSSSRQLLRALMPAVLVCCPSLLLGTNVLADTL